MAKANTQRIASIRSEIYSGCRYVRKDAVGEVGELGLTQLIPEVIDRAKNDRFGIVREKAITVLGRIGKGSSEAIDTLKYIVEHHYHPDEKDLAEQALAQLAA